MTAHLNEEQLQALLANPRQTHEHLAHCPACTEELIQLRATFNDLRSALTALALEPAKLPAAAPARPKPAPRNPARPNLWRATLTFAAACTLLAATVAPHRHPKPAPVSTATQQEDEALLEAIDQDLSTPLAPSLNPLTFSTTGAPKR